MRILSGMLATATLMLAPASAFAHGQKKHDTTTSNTESSELFESESSTQGRLGLEVMGLTPQLRKYFTAGDNRGVLVAKVEKGSIAEKAGLQVGDILVGVNGKTIKHAGDVLGALADTKEGQRIKLDIVRDKRPITMAARMSANGPTSAELQWMRDMPYFGNDNTTPAT